MKKTIIFILVLCMLFSVQPVTATEETGEVKDITVVVGGEKIKCDVAPFMVNDRTMLPVRAVFEAIGAEVSWDESAQKVTAKKENTTVEIVIGSNIIKINGEEKIIDVPAMEKNGRTFVPVRACAEAFGFKVNWYEGANMIKLVEEAWVISREENYYGFTEYKYNPNGTRSCIYSEKKTGEWEKEEYNLAGKLILVDNSDGEWIKYYYDHEGNCIFVLSYEGSWMNYAYDANGNMTYENEDGMGWMRKTYDEQGRLKTMELPGQKTEYVYTDDGYTTYFENKWGEEWVNKYDKNDNLLSADLVSDVADYRTKDKYGNILIVSHSAGKYEIKKYSRDGAPLGTYSTEGPYIVRKYNENGKIIKEETAFGLVEVYEYDEKGNLLSVTSSDNNGEKYIYDEAGNKIHFEKENGYFEKYEYDKMGNIIYFDTSDKPWEKYEYDEAGNKTYFENENGYFEKYEYDEKGNLLSYSDYYKKTKNYTYDERGNLIYYEDSDGYWTKYEYDENNNLIYKKTQRFDEEFKYEYIKIER